MELKRRAFIGGAAAFVPFAKAMAMPKGAPAMRLGVMTDTHVGKTVASCGRVRMALELFKENHTSGKPVRSLSVSASNLIYKEEIQLSLDPAIMREQRREMAECAVDRINERFGKGAVVRGVYLADPELTSLHIHSGVEHVMPGLMNM